MKNLIYKIFLLFLLPLSLHAGTDNPVMSSGEGFCGQEATYRHKDPALYALIATQCGWTIDASNKEALSFAAYWKSVSRNQFSKIVLSQPDQAAAKNLANAFVKMMKAEFAFYKIPDSFGPEVNTNNALEETLSPKKKELPQESLVKFALEVSAKIKSEGHLETIQSSLIALFNEDPQSFIQMLLRLSVTNETNKNWCQRLITNTYLDKFIQFLRSSGNEGMSAIQPSAFKLARQEVQRLREDNRKKGKAASPCLNGQLDVFEKALSTSGPFQREGSARSNH